MKDDKIEVIFEGRLYELYRNLELQFPGGRLYSVYSEAEFIDCILCWENESQEIDRYWFVGRYEPAYKRLLEKLAGCIKKCS